MVEAIFVADVQDNQHAGGKADGQAGDVNDGVAFVFPKVAQGHFEIVLNHNRTRLLFVILKTSNQKINGKDRD